MRFGSSYSVDTGEFYPLDVQTKAGSQVQADRMEAAIAISQNQADIAAQAIAFEQQKLSERAKMMKYASIGAAVLVALLIIRKK